MTRAVVVGSGPNGLTGAAILARAGLDVTVLEAEPTIGGGARSGELTVPGLLHDVCSAVHPLGAASPAFTDLGLDRHGLRFAQPEIALAHPLDGGQVAVVHRSVDETAAGFGSDGAAWRRLFAPLAEHFDAVAAEVLQPILHVPKHPVTLARFGPPALLPATALTRIFRGDHARAAFAGVSAHAFRPLSSFGSSAVSLMLTSALHSAGWPMALGGSQAIADALVAVLQEHGGRVETGRRVTSLDEIDADVVLLDVAPAAVVSLAGARLPGRIARAYRRYRHGPAAFKIDLAVDGGVPWMREECRRAGTLHLGGTLEQMAAAERDAAAGRMPDRPYVLVAQQYLADPTRSSGDVHPVWAYAHVPHGYDGDATDAILDQFERFAPGTRDRIVGMAVAGPAELEQHNANYVGGDIGGGLNDLRQLLLKPRPAVDPYATGIPGVYLCSASTPPGAGVHGMCGANAAASALRELRR